MALLQKALLLPLYPLQPVAVCIACEAISQFEETRAVDRWLVIVLTIQPLDLLPFFVSLVVAAFFALAAGVSDILCQRGRRHQHRGCYPPRSRLTWRFPLQPGTELLLRKRVSQDGTINHLHDGTRDHLLVVAEICDAAAYDLKY